ncbi:type II toxin-antitoxin system RelE/ParE family toxin [Salegentibacter sp. JZCK2]|uniref:type II toxin-antitoxin system RelE/ParE family toxin n=1 Tax=Salegentibacter tibetensis TaxID=2873600 RepID=UPI001CCEED6E|nr:type II toxin-antitoxin system RelE/ParE family toxin [Salegentibacter tibetensis]MBZ9731664.1 type II toxin-antitoxin system RelE/ParE family toxin [Salegentibacter tibetensis]
MRYKISLEAEEDLIRIYRYGAQHFGDKQALKYFYGLVDTFDRIAENPYMFPSARHIKQDYRFCTYKADTIYYRIADKVEIMAIIGRQNFPFSKY